MVQAETLPAMAVQSQEGQKEHKQEYTCRKCRMVIFNSDDIMEHSSGVKKLVARAHKKHNKAPEECTSHFIELADWMNLPDDGSQQGKILCPKCNEKLGAYAHYGA